MNWYSIYEGAACIVAGIPMILKPAMKRAQAEHVAAKRLAELEAGTKQAFFEERRTLQAYPPYKTDARWRIAGATLLFLGFGVILLEILPR